MTYIRIYTKLTDIVYCWAKIIIFEQEIINYLVYGDVMKNQLNNLNSWEQI